MKIIVTGGCGFTGSVLVDQLLSEGHAVKVIDNFWFGNYLRKQKNLKIVKKDIRNLNVRDIKGYKIFIHLANIANDPSVALDTNLSWDVNVLGSKKLIELCVKEKFEQFIYASSGSVYGLKKEKRVTEDLELVPISIYNKTKMISERVLMSYADKLKIHCIRPATVCGFSPRMRTDVSVNMFVHQALKLKKIVVFGGQQIRPNININDLTNVYSFFVKNRKKISSGFYNAGFENMKIIDIAKLVQKIVPCNLTVKKVFNDPRSYRQDSQKLINLGFKQNYSVEKAILDIVQNYKKGKIKFNESCNTVNWMKKRKYK